MQLTPVARLVKSVAEPESDSESAGLKLLFAFLANRSQTGRREVIFYSLWVMILRRAEGAVYYLIKGALKATAGSRRERANPKILSAARGAFSSRLNYSCQARPEIQIRAVNCGKIISELNKNANGPKPGPLAVIKSICGAQIAGQSG